jgi:crotonobetainyl-CoA:carnitine CoA-transferase CaiB-like acyl-CoA transferase
VGVDETADDPRFATFKTRLANREGLTRLLDEALSMRCTAEWLAAFAGEVPAVPVHGIAKILTSAFVTEEERVWSYVHPERPVFRMVALAFHLPGTTKSRDLAPALGADS